MTHEAQRRSGDADGVLLEGPDTAGARAVPVAVVRLTSLRSPILEHRETDPFPREDDRPTLLLPPLRAFIGPVRFALLVAAPLLLFVSLQVALIVAVAAPILRAIRNRLNRTAFTFGQGFLPYREETGWPRGVQEDNDVHWNWTSARIGPRITG